MKPPKTVTVTSTVDLDEISYVLQTNLKTKQLIEFVLSMGEDLTDCENYYKGLHEELSKYNLED